MRRGIIVGAVLVLALSGCGGEPEEAAEPTEQSSPAQLNVDGVLVLTDSGGFGYESDGTYGDVCFGLEGYDDINVGAQVVVRDSSGEQVGLGELGEGFVNNRGPSRLCEFPFSVDGVPNEGELFSVEVAGRGEVSFARDEATRIRVSLG